MDFVSSAGFGFLPCISPCTLRHLLYSWPVGLMHLRLALYVVLCELPDAMNLIAPDCGSWITTSRGSSLRSSINPLGRQGLQWVDDNNCTVSRSIDCTYRVYIIGNSIASLSGWRLRCVLLILLILSKHGAWVLEQPQGSLLSEHPRWQWLCNRVAKETYLHVGL